MTYEKPKLTRVGNAKDLVLGVLALGSDMDGNYIPSGGGYAEDVGPDGSEVIIIEQ